MSDEMNLAPGFKTPEAWHHALRKRLAEGPVKVPMMPQIASQVMALTTNPNTDIADLSDLIHRDPALAARVLQVANSAAFRGEQEIESLPEAVHRLGIQTLSEITLSASLQAGVFRAPGFETEVQHLWRHTLASAYFGKELARLKGGPSDTWFLCGLLHAIGKPALLQMIGDLKRQHDFLIQPQALRSLLDQYHWPITTRMATEWNLPRPVQAACAHYQKYTAAPEWQREAASTYLADRLASWLTHSAEVDEQTLQHDEVLTVLEFAAGDFPNVVQLKESVQGQVAALER